MGAKAGRSDDFMSVTWNALLATAFQQIKNAELYLSSSVFSQAKPLVEIEEQQTSIDVQDTVN